LCPHSEHQKNISSNLKALNIFTKETSSNKVKLPKVGSNAIVPIYPCEGREGPNNEAKRKELGFIK
jgi:hypothetical protein